MDEAAISTIDAWVLKMLQEHAFESGSLFEQQLVPDQSERIRQAVTDYWRGHFSMLDEQQAMPVHRLFPLGPADLQQRLGTLLDRPEARIQYAGEPVGAGELQRVLMGAAARSARSRHAISFNSHIDRHQRWPRDTGPCAATSPMPSTTTAG